MNEVGRKHLRAQREFYDARDHEHLRVDDGDAYAMKLAERLARDAGIRPEHRGLEVGAGFGRFTFPLLKHCGSLVALDLSPRVLEDLARTRDERGIPESQCRTHCGDVTALDPDEFAGSFDFVVGFFILHHLPDVSGAIAKLASVLRPGGRMIFLEPNRRNPLFALQVLACPDMTWREEKGMFRLSARSVGDAFAAAGLTRAPVETFGFFPPQVFNPLPSARGLEARLERLRILRPLLPFLVLSAAKAR